MKVFVGLVTLVATAAAVENYFRMPSPYRYSCLEENCVREEFNAPHREEQQHQHQVQDAAQQARHHHTPQQYTTLEECNLVCGKYGSLWPRPSKEVTLDQETTRFMPQNIRFTKVAASNQEVEEMLMEQAHYFQRNLHFMHPNYPQKSKGPFTEYQEEKFQNYDRQRNNQQSQRRRTPFEDRFFEEYHMGGDDVARFDLFELDDRNDRLRRQPLNQEQTQGQRFESQFNNQQQRRGREQMRYERISPFNKQQASPMAERQNFDVEITVTGQETQLRLETDESYDLAVQTIGDTTTATIIAAEYYGARHALETLSQLIAYDELSNSLQVVRTAKIADEPQFRYRGMLLDTGRNYYPKEEILSLLDTMATNKLNTFHWHISDSASFPLYSQRQPEMTLYGAYSPRKVYYPQDVREIVEYANQRGIRVIPELDAPAHAGAGWNFGEQAGKGKLTLCNDPDDVWFNMCNEPPCGQLNPTNPEVYNVLENVYTDILESFNPEFVHMGGDDTSFKCWKNSPEIVNFLKEQGRPVDSRELFELWNTFQTQAYNKVKESQRRTGITKSVTPMIYSSSFVRNYIDPKEYVVQITDEANATTVEEYVNRGYEVVFSNSDVWSLEGPAASWVSVQARFINARDTPRPSWMEVYENSPLDMLNNYAIQGRQEYPNVLGGEAMLWSYETDAESVQSTAWPRGAALAERLWTDLPLSEVRAEEAGNRMAVHRERMVNRGTRAETFQPEYCFQNQNSCYSQEYKLRRDTERPQGQ